jgi:two-component system phosphate regulon sensor histidine kinase PhoR
MPKRRLVWTLVPTYWAVAAVTALAAAWAGLRVYERSLLEAARADLRARGAFFLTQLNANPAASQEFAALARDYQKATGLRVAIVGADRKVAFDSQDRPQELEDILGRGELAAAARGVEHDVLRWHAALDQQVLHMALPIPDEPGAALYLAQPVPALEQGTSAMRKWFLVVGGVMLLLCVPWAARVALGLAGALAPVRQAIDRFAAGQFASRSSVPEPRELSELAESYNRMASLLQNRLSQLLQSNNEQRAVLASMAEGVLAVDSQERVISVNPASSRLLGLDPAQAQGRPLREVIRNADLVRFISRALAGQEPLEADVALHGDRERVLQARGSTLHDATGRPMGAVIVLNDVTDFRRLEDIRRDFVANVSHELKTPVTSIKGFVETLLDGAAKDAEDSERFLRIIAKQSDRLHAIIEDLLSLSKIEQSEDDEDIVLEPAALRGVLESAVHNCESAAADKRIQIELDCPADLTANINPLLLEQAVVNLIDNAIKYSEPERDVQVSTAAESDAIVIHVADHGSGISSEHLPRVFERFYRVDRARSRKLGGTGLGLAIVKHIVQAHRGRVTADSTLGVGSTFTIRLPKPPATALPA